MKKKRKLAVFFPGIGYHKDKPLLYYSAKLAAAAGYEVRSIEYSDMPRKIKGDTAMMQKAAELAFSQAKEQLAGEDFSDCGKVLLIGKSIGTVCAAKYAKDYLPEAAQIWYTPVEATFSFESENVIAFIGDADPWSDVGSIIQTAKKQGIELHVYPSCNHSLECENMDRNLENLREVMRLSDAFIRGFDASFPKGYDEELAAFLRQDDDIRFRPFLAGGEEDYEDEEEQKQAYVSSVRAYKIRKAAGRLYRDKDLSEDYRKQYVSYLQKSDPKIFFSALLGSPDDREACKSVFADYALYKDLEKDRLLALAQGEVELRALILQREEAKGSSDFEL